jgi:hypothetical protein
MLTRERWFVNASRVVVVQKSQKTKTKAAHDTTRSKIKKIKGSLAYVMDETLKGWLQDTSLAWR